MKKQLLFLLLCATISFNGLAQSISFTSATLTTAVIGSTITVNYKYTNPAAGNIYCAINLLNGWTWTGEVVGQALSPAPAGTDVTGSFSLTIPSGTSSTASLVLPQNYKINIVLSNSSWQYITGDFPGTEINLTAAPLGIDKKNLANGLSVYPNPVSDVLKIANADNLSNASFSIVDILGKTVIQSKAFNNEAIDVSNLSSGVYILSVSSEDATKQLKFQKN